MIAWPEYVPHREGFAEALDQRFYTIDYLDGLILSGVGLLWVGHDAAIIAEIKEYPTGARVIHGLAATGDLDGIIGLIADAEMFGKQNGCFAAIIESRPGWARALKEHGYELHQAAIIKEL